MAVDLKLAPSGDASLQGQPIGERARRLQLYGLLDRCLQKRPITSVLQVGCATGEDAIWLAAHGLEVLAVDACEKTVELARRKSAFPNPAFDVAGLTDLKRLGHQKFGLVFSGFGAVDRCSPIELHLFFNQSAGLLQPDGHMALVVKPRRANWKQRLSRLIRQWSRLNRTIEETPANESVFDYCYNPKEMASFASAYFSVESIHPIGLFAPSALERLFGRHASCIAVLRKMDRRLANQRNLARYANHYLILLRKTACV